MFSMLPMLPIFLAGLSGLLALPTWTVLPAATGLATISYARHASLFRRAGDLGMQHAIDQTLVSSLFNGVLASGMAYGCGVALRVLSLG